MLLSLLMYATLSEESPEEMLGAGIIFVIVMSVLIGLALAALMIAGFWKIFLKAGQHGWAAIVPFYNLYVLFKISWGNGWYFLLWFVPIVGQIVWIIIFLKLSEVFGHKVGFALGLIFLTFIFVPILGLGKSKYLGLTAKK